MKPGTFQKGDSRINRKGRPKVGQSLAEKFRDALNEVIDPETGYTKLDSIMDKMLTKAQQGNLNAADMAFIRAYGKPIERIETNNINKNYDFSKLSMEERLKLHETLNNVSTTVPSDNPDTE